MKFDFTSIMDRHGKDAIAVDAKEAFCFPIEGCVKEGFDKIPMWVADMNFPTVPTVAESIIERAKHPAYGYFEPREEYYEAIINWQKERNGATGLKRENIGYENGVLGGVASALRVLTQEGEDILVHSPIYIGFRAVLRNNGFHAVESPLQLDDTGVYRMDLEDMERKIKKKHIHTAIFCSPHNPTGRVWTEEETKAAMELFKKYNVYVITDEIWSNLVLEGQKHIPPQSVSEDARRRTIALYAPSKTFNLAGLIGSYHIIYNEYLRDRVERQASLSHYNNMNLLSMYALIGAYSSTGAQWLEELRQVLTGNIDFACRYIKTHFEGVTAARPEGTYMLFLDCKQWLMEHGMTLEDLLAEGIKVGVIWQDGRLFKGETHIRLNLALPYSRVEEAFHRLDAFVFNK